MSFGSIDPAKDVRTGCPDTPSDGFVSHGLKDQAITLFLDFLACHDVPEVMAESSSPCRRLSEIMGGDLPSLLSFCSASGGMWAVTEVVYARLINGKWRVRSRMASGVTVDEIFDAMVVCNGHGIEPRTAEISGLANSG
ncbi:Flavin-containing monooxygenase FMO GS-OX2 [Vitis vinifera]|uniref:Flavin-containing monooxygenase FMO GS-OX2 n=1 Tax=Vitis vinifera TaxID=29760 RepID=A0A438ESE3_VITVI|nr:Flavin-containing monooxygenase FMO GS-OX2 [Vitis vinifera]